MAATRAQGTTLKMKVGSGAQQSVGRLTSVGEIEPEAEEVDVTTLESTGGYREYIQGFRDSGEVVLEGYHDAGDAGQKAVRSAFASGSKCEFEVDFPDGTKAEFSGFIKKHSIGSAEVDGAIGFGAVIRVSGPVTVTEAS